MKRNWQAGCAGFPVSLDEYFKKLTAVEVQETFFEPPAKRTLERWRRSAPAGFAFVVRAWQLITHPEVSPGYRRMRALPDWASPGQLGFFRPGDAVRRAWEILRETAEALEARAILFETPHSFTPSRENRENLVRFFSEAPRGKQHLVWHAEGMWTEAEVETLSRQLDLIPAIDPLVTPVPCGRFVYFRFPGRTRGAARYTTDDFYRILQAVEARGKRGGKEGILIWTSRDGIQDAERFRSWFTEEQGGRRSG